LFTEKVEDYQACNNQHVATIIMQNQYVGTVKTFPTMGISDKENWHIDMYRMHKVENLAEKIKLNLFKIDCYIEELLGSYELESHSLLHSPKDFLKNLQNYYELRN